MLIIKCYWCDMFMYSLSKSKALHKLLLTIKFLKVEKSAVYFLKLTKFCHRAQIGTEYLLNQVIDEHSALCSCICIIMVS